MAQAVVARLDECGRVLEGHEISDEYKKLKERGIAVFSIHVSGLHFEPTVESQLLQRWNTNWLSPAKDEQDRIERLDLVYAEKGRQKALLDHAFTLSEALSKERITNISAAVKVLLQKTQSEIKLNDRFLSRLSSEPENLEELVKWVETKDL